MLAATIYEYLSLVQRPTGAALVVIVSLVACTAMAWWAWRRTDVEHALVFLAAGALTAVSVVTYVVLVVGGWWQGAYFQTPLLLQLAVFTPVSLAAWLAWLLGYRWLASHSRHPLLIYAIVALLAIPTGILADRSEATGGLVRVAPDGLVWTDMVVGIVVLLAPLLVFEALRRRLSDDVLP